MRGRNVGMWWGTAIEAPDPRVLAEFYSSMLDWPVTHADDQVAIIAPPQGSIYMVFQLAEDFVPPVWPPATGQQRAIMHLDFEVDDLEHAVADAVARGARVASFQPQDKVRVLFDPAGHPFCLCLDD